MTPDWVLQALWWGAGVLGGSLLFYFLQVGALGSALWTGFATVVVVLLAITLAIQNGILSDESKAAVSMGTPAEGRESPDGPQSPRLDPEARYIRDGIVTLVHEMRLVSGKDFRKECRLMPGEKLGPAKPPMAMLILASGKFTVVESLHPLASAFAGVEAGFLFRHDPALGGRVVKRGYERVVDEYQSILGKPWILAVDRYKDGEPLTGNEAFHICAYGLRPVDDGPLEAIMSALDAAEASG